MLTENNIHKKRKNLIMVIRLKLKIDFNFLNI